MPFGEVGTPVVPTPKKVRPAAFAVSDQVQKFAVSAQVLKVEVRPTRLAVQGG